MSQSVAEIIQITGFVCGLGGALLIYAQYGRFVHILGTALFMGALGVLAVVAGTVPQGPGVPILLFVIGLIAAVLAARVNYAGHLTVGQLRVIGFLLAFASLLAQFLLNARGLPRLL